MIIVCCLMYKDTPHMWADILLFKTPLHLNWKKRCICAEQMPFLNFVLPAKSEWNISSAVNLENFWTAPLNERRNQIILKAS